jgi:hypothetical protein
VHAWRLLIPISGTVSRQRVRRRTRRGEHAVHHIFALALGRVFCRDANTYRHGLAVAPLDQSEELVEWVRVPAAGYLGCERMEFMILCFLFTDFDYAIIKSFVLNVLISGRCLAGIFDM